MENGDSGMHLMPDATEHRIHLHGFLVVAGLAEGAITQRDDRVCCQDDGFGPCRRGSKAFAVGKAQREGIRTLSGPRGFIHVGGDNLWRIAQLVEQGQSARRGRGENQAGHGAGLAFTNSSSALPALRPTPVASAST